MWYLWATSQHKLLGYTGQRINRKNPEVNFKVSQDSDVKKLSYYSTNLIHENFEKVPARISQCKFPSTKLCCSIAILFTQFVHGLRTKMVFLRSHTSPRITRRDPCKLHCHTSFYGIQGKREIGSQERMTHRNRTEGSTKKLTLCLSWLRILTRKLSKWPSFMRVLRTCSGDTGDPIAVDAASPVSCIFLQARPRLLTLLPYSHHLLSSFSNP